VASDTVFITEVYSDSDKEFAGDWRAVAQSIRFASRARLDP
jgi:hypothetical protein